MLKTVRTTERRIARQIVSRTNRQIDRQTEIEIVQSWMDKRGEKEADRHNGRQKNNKYSCKLGDRIEEALWRWTVKVQTVSELDSRGTDGFESIL